MANQSNLFVAPSAPMKEARDYQNHAVDSLFEYFAKHDGSPLIVAPTGSGKSLIIAEFIRKANVRFPKTRMVVLSHVAILLQQNAEELISRWPEASISFYSDSIGQKDLSGDIVFAGIQSIYKKAYDFRHAPEIIIVDEAHTISPEGGSMYRQFFDAMKTINPDIKIVGLTATPFRAGYGMLHKGKNALFTHIAYEIPILELIQRGHLCPIVTPDGGVRTKMDTTGIGVCAGDYIQSKLAKVVDDIELTRACIDEVMVHGMERKKWIAFTVDINHCMHVYEELKARGVDAEMVHSKMDSADCARAIDRFKNGSARCLVNVAMLTTGVNLPEIDMLIFMRPTRSPVLYIQCAGRGLRTFPGKVNCLLLDFGGVVDQLGPIDQVHVAQKGEGEGIAPFKVCEACGKQCAAGCSKCPECGHPFPEPGLNLKDKASDAAVLSSQAKAKVLGVSRVLYTLHKKEGKPDSMRVDYLCGLETYREWICFEHVGFAREKACAWWKERAHTTPPSKVSDALMRSAELRKPLQIHVRKIGAYHEVIKADFELTKENV